MEEPSLKAFTLVLVAAGLAVGGSWWIYRDGLTATERSLFHKIDAALESAPPQPAEVDAAFGLETTCSEFGCFYDAGSIGEMTHQGGDLRRSDDGLIFVLEDLSGACVRTQAVMDYFNTGLPEEGCSHGGCWYTQAQHSWGILAFEVEKPSSACVSSVVINSEPYQRREPVIIEVEGRAVCIQNC